MMVWNLNRRLKTWVLLIPGFIAFQGKTSAFIPDTTHSRIKYSLLPTAYYIPETGVAAGALAYANLWNPSDSTSKKGNLQHYVSVTQKRQVLLENSWFLFAHSNRWLVMGNLDLLRFPEIFFGIGSSPKMNCPPVFYQADQFRFSNLLLYGIVKDVYLGMLVRSEALNMPEARTTVGMEKLNMVIGGKGYLVGGVGPALIWDTRDFALNPKKGHYLDVRSSYFLFPNQQPFRMHSFDLRSYFSNQAQTGTLAMQMVYQSASSGTPFRMMPGLGGAGLMRGFYFGRHRDKNLWVLQAEWRQKIAGRFGVTVFSGLGDVGYSPTDLISNVHHHIGAGLRWQIKKEDKVNLRFDVAKAGDDINVYVVLAEAF